MKRLVIGAVALVIVIQVASTYYLTNRIRLLRACVLIQRLCRQECDDALSDTLNANNARRILDSVAHNQARFDCVSQHGGDNAALRECNEEADRVFNERMAQLDASDAAASETRERCVAECRREKDECDAYNDSVFSNPTGAVAANVDVVGTVTAGCLDDGGPCFVPVSDFCQRASGACDQCTLSLCGGGEWIVETVGNQLPVDTTLVAASDPSKNPRVLATSTTRGNQVVLNVPSNIKLGEGEHLYFGFKSQKKPGGPVDVRIRRRK